MVMLHNKNQLIKPGVTFLAEDLYGNLIETF